MFVHALFIYKAPEVASRMEGVSMEGVRTSVCDVTFTWLSQYKHHTKHMGEHVFVWFMMEMLDAHNGVSAQGIASHLPQTRRSQ